MLDWFKTPSCNFNNLLDDESINMDVKSESSDDDIFNEFEEDEEETPKKTNGTKATNDSESGEDDGDEEMDYSD